MDRNEVMSKAILLCDVGSTAHGLNVATSDVDEMGVLIEDLHQNLQIAGKGFEQVVTTKPDSQIYSLQKFVRLALAGNPTVLTVFFAPVNFGNAIGESLRGLAPEFASKEAGKRFLGYLHNQRQRLLGLQGQKDVNRADLIALYGFDTKYAMHMLRLGFQGVEYLTSGKMTLPMAEKQRSLLLDVRQGKYSQDACIDMCMGLEEEINELLTTSPLPDQPNKDRILAWTADVYFDEWARRRDLAAKPLESPYKK